MKPAPRWRDRADVAGRPAGYTVETTSRREHPHAADSARAVGGGEPFRGHNLLRRLLLAHYVPRLKGEIAVPPVTHNTWFAFNEGNNVTETNQLEAMRPWSTTGIEGYWLDAGWFEGGWPAGAGSWVPKKEAFPRGLKPLGDAAHKLGMKFVLWFEPERVTGMSRIAKDHPEWVLHAGGGDGLFNLASRPRANG